MLKPWVEGPFDLLLHGELHYRGSTDFDRRMALISFDNAIEVSVATYLGLNPALRSGGRQYERRLVDQWKANFHTKIDFLEFECGTRGGSMRIERTHFIWYHDQRNDQYHEGRAATPTLIVLEGVRRASLWVFEFLFDVPGVDQLLEERIIAMESKKVSSERSDEFDSLIDAYCGEVKIGDLTDLASEVLHSHDAEAYRALGLELREFSRSEETA